VRYLALILFSGSMLAQSLALGVKGGVPLSDAFKVASGGPVSYSTITRRYTVGPTVEVGLPLIGFRVEADALYRRMGWDSSRAGTALLESYVSTVRAGAWDFDVLLKRRLLGALVVHPYLGGGAAFRRLFTTRETFLFPGPPSRFVTKQMIDEVRRKNIAGLVFSAGVELGGPLRIAPEFRYTRWLMNNVTGPFPIGTEANQAEVLVSITFGKH
jgi:hypothetical protein